MAAFLCTGSRRASYRNGSSRNARHIWPCDHTSDMHWYGAPTSRRRGTQRSRAPHPPTRSRRKFSAFYMYINKESLSCSFPAPPLWSCGSPDRIVRPVLILQQAAVRIHPSRICLLAYDDAPDFFQLAMFCLEKRHFDLRLPVDAVIHVFSHVLHGCHFLSCGKRS